MEHSDRSSTGMGTDVQSLLGDDHLQQLSHAGELIMAGELDTACDVLENAVAAKPDDDKGRDLLGLVYFKLGKFENAAEIYETLAATNPDDASLRVNLGIVHLKRGLIDQAVQSLEEATRLAPAHRKANHYLGLALAQRDDYARARVSFMVAGSTRMVETMDRALAGEPYQSLEEAPQAQVSQPPASQFADVSEESAANEDAAGSSSLRMALAHAAREGALAEAEPDASDAGASAELQAEDAAAFDRLGEQLAAEASVAASQSEASESFDEPGAGEREVTQFYDARADAQRREPEHDEAGDDGVESLAFGNSRDDSAGGDEPADDAAPHDPSGEQYADEGGDGGDGGDNVAESAEAAAEPSATPSGVAAQALDALTPEAVPFHESDFRIRPAAVTFEQSLYVRRNGLRMVAGDLTLQVVKGQFGGRPTEKTFGIGESQMVRLEGRGTAWIDSTSEFVSMDLAAGESVYLREDIVFAFEPSLQFENGKMKSKVAPDLALVYVTGPGRVLLKLEGAWRSMTVTASAPVIVPSAYLVGWSGPLMPTSVVSGWDVQGRPAEASVRLAGEGLAMVAM